MARVATEKQNSTACRPLYMEKSHWRVGELKNYYEIRGETTAIFIKDKDGKILETIIDTENLPKVQNISGSWCAYKAKNNGMYYVCGYDKGKRPILHLLLLDFPLGLLVDHKDNDTLNNKKINLRAVNNAINSQNRKGAAKNNKSSGYRNVTYHKSSGKWHVSIQINKKVQSIGYYNSVEEANMAAIKTRKELLNIS